MIRAAPAISSTVSAAHSQRHQKGADLRGRGVPLMMISNAVSA